MVRSIGVFCGSSSRGHEEYRQALRDFVGAVVAEGFAHPEHAELITIVPAVADVLPALANAPATRVPFEAAR
jgi:predicted Rossmann-fold nucleotide-binding protein